MKRRSLLTAMGTLAATSVAPQLFGVPGFINSASANISQRKVLNARALVMDSIGYSKPTVLPQVINIFLYGGPSELGGNLTNIEDINAMSLNKYSNQLLPTTNGTFYTPNGFWGGGNNGAGGEIMERMVASQRMTVVRTLNRIKDNSRAHRPSIFSNLTGMIGEDDSRPGIATNLASILYSKNILNQDALFPFVTFEGESIVFNQGDTSIPPQFKPISLNQNLRNPYERTANAALGDSDAAVEALAKSVMSVNAAKHQKVVEAFNKRAEIEGFIQQLKANIDNAAPVVDPDAPAPAPGENPTLLNYPNTNFGNRLKAAINLVIGNPDTLFVSLGSGGLGGWDDHNNASEEYTTRMRSLMQALEVAAKHLEVAGKDNVIITVYGDFGRNANLNNSKGWDHGNNQNLFMVGAGPSAGAGIAGNQLGKIIGKTEAKGDANQNRLYTYPTADSYQAEPFAVASTLYKYFGITNPEALTGEMPIDETGAPNEWIDPNA